jgi:hypothetical protein
LKLHIFVAREFVETGDDEVVFQEPVAGTRRFELVVRQDLEGELEAAVKFVLPLLGQAAGADDETTLQVAACDQFLDEQSGHDGLACAGVIGEQESQRLTGEHGLVDGRDLVRQRFDEGRVHSQHRVEEMRQTDAMRLRNQAEQMPVAVEAPRAAVLHDLEARLVMAIEQLVGNAARRSFISQLQSLGAKPLHADHRDDLLRQNSPDCGGWLEIFEAGHVALRVSFPAPWAVCV